MNEHEQMLTEILNCKRVDLYSDPKMLNVDQELQLDEMKKRRAQGEPLQYIIGHCDFMGVNLNVDDRVLVPRPETEILVEFAINKIKSFERSGYLKILDLGCGSGNIPIALAKNIEQCSVTTVDVSPQAIDVAAYNAKMHFVEDRIQFVCKDMFEYFLNPSEKDFDLIISNPPYIPTGDLKNLPEDVKREPRTALDGGADGLKFYRSIIANAATLLKTDGCLICEIGDGQDAEIKNIISGNEYFSDVEFVNDYRDVPRIFCARLK